MLKTVDKDKERVIKKKDFLSLTIAQTANGVTVKAKSVAIERFYRKLSSNESAECDSNFVGKTYYLNDLAVLCPGISVRMHGPPQRSLITKDGCYNFTWLQMVGLARGITFNIDTPISTAVIEKFMNAAKTYIKELSINYVKRHKFSIKFECWE